MSIIIPVLRLRLVKMVKMKLKTNTSLLVLYVCYWPGLEDRSSGPGIVSRSLSRGEFVSLSSKHGFFFAREKSLQMKAIIERERRSIRTDGGRSDAPTTVVGRVRTHLHSSTSLSRACVCVGRAIRDGRRSSNPAEERTLTFLVRVSA